MFLEALGCLQVHKIKQIADMKMPFVEIQGINLDSISLVVEYCFCKLAAFRKGAHLELLFTCPHKNRSSPDRGRQTSVPVSLNPNKKQPGSESN